jgi:hypothetical protein
MTIATLVGYLRFCDKILCEITHNTSLMITFFQKFFTNPGQVWMKFYTLKDKPVLMWLRLRRW